MSALPRLRRASSHDRRPVPDRDALDLEAACVDLRHGVEGGRGDEDEVTGRLRVLQDELDLGLAHRRVGRGHHAGVAGVGAEERVALGLEQCTASIVAAGHLRERQCHSDERDAGPGERGLRPRAITSHSISTSSVHGHAFECRGRVWRRHGCHKRESVVGLESSARGQRGLRRTTTPAPARRGQARASPGLRRAAAL